MRYAIVSDIHGNLPALEAVVADMRFRHVDAVINLGDSLSGPLYPQETADYLMAQNWLHLAGNHERNLLTQLTGERNESDEYAFKQLTEKTMRWLTTLKHSIQLTPEILLCHGTPTSDTIYLLETVDESGIRYARPAEIEMRLGRSQDSLVLCGHSHVPRAVHSITGVLMVNPGSVGLPAYSEERPYPHRVENGSPDARYAIVEERHGKWIPELISVPYNHISVAQLALERGRRDWASALLTGYTAR